MSYCGPRGLPHSHFLGGPPVWTDADRDKARAWQARQAQTCGGCGTHPDDFDPEQGGHRHAYAIDVTACPACALLENARKDKATADVPGRRIRLRRRTKAELTQAGPTRRARRRG